MSELNDGTKNIDINDNYWLPLEDWERDKEKLNENTMTYWQDAWRRLKKDKLAVFSMIFLLIIIFISIFLSLRWVWDSYIIWQISLWQTFLVALILPIVLNFILKKFGIKMDDITIFF